MFNIVGPIGVCVSFICVVLLCCKGIQWMHERIAKSLLEQQMPEKGKRFLIQRQSHRVLEVTDKKKLKKRIRKSAGIFFVGVIGVVGGMFYFGWGVCMDEVKLKECWGILFVMGMCFLVLVILVVRDFYKIRLVNQNKESYAVFAFVLRMMPCRGGKRIYAAYFDHLQGKFLSTCFILDSAEVGKIQEGGIVSIAVAENQGKLEYVGIL